MSNPETSCTASDSQDCPAPLPSERIESKKAMVGESLPIRRALPNPRRRMIGAWCFLDHAGPVPAGPGAQMRVGPHPHIGLQTFTWMIEGSLLHRDSLGYAQVIRPGQVNLMTAGRGISHSEESVPDDSAGLHCAQLWIALPDGERHREPAFDHYPDLPRWEQEGFQVTLLAGAHAGHEAPARLYTPLLGMDLSSAAAASATLEMNPAFEHGAMMLSGSARVEGELLETGALLYFAPGRRTLKLECDDACRLLLLGGEPFPERVLLWWNFVGRAQDEIEQATREWNAGAGEGTRFGEVRGYEGAPLCAPDLAGLHLRGG